MEMQNVKYFVGIFRYLDTQKTSYETCCRLSVLTFWTLLPYFILEVFEVRNIR